MCMAMRQTALYLVSRKSSCQPCVAGHRMRQSENNSYVQGGKGAGVAKGAELLACMWRHIGSTSGGWLLPSSMGFQTRGHDNTTSKGRKGCSAPGFILGTARLALQTMVLGQFPCEPRSISTPAGSSNWCGS